MFRIIAHPASVYKPFLLPPAKRANPIAETNIFCYTDAKSTGKDAVFTKRIEYGKIVRDRIPEIIEKNGQRAVCRIPDKKEIIRGLEVKLTEELSEYLEDHSLEEMADLLEVMHGILHHRGVSWDELEKIRLEKQKKRGGFERGIYLEATEES